MGRLQDIAAWLNQQRNSVMFGSSPMMFRPTTLEDQLRLLAAYPETDWADVTDDPLLVSNFHPSRDPGATTNPTILITETPFQPGRVYRPKARTPSGGMTESVSNWRVQDLVTGATGTGFTLTTNTGWSRKKELNSVMVQFWDNASRSANNAFGNTTAAFLGVEDVVFGTNSDPGGNEVTRYILASAVGTTAAPPVGYPASSNPALLGSRTLIFTWSPAIPLPYYHEVRLRIYSPFIGSGAGLFADADIVMTFH